MATSKSKNYLILLLALTTVAGGVLAWNQYQELIKLRTGGLTDSARTDLQKRLWDLEKRKNELEAEIAGLRARGNPTGEGDVSPTVAENPPAPARGQGRFGRRNGSTNLSTLLDNPEFNKLWTDQQKALINSTYGALFKNLNLTPEQTAQFQNLLAERQMSMLDVLSAARAEGITGRGQIGSLMQQTSSQIDSQIQSLLGPDGYSQYNNYLQTMPQRNQVNQLQTLLVTSGAAPLQDYQTQQLTQILAQNSVASSSGPRMGGGGGGGGFLGAMGGMGELFATPVTGPTITPNAVTQAASVLTSAQLQIFQQMQQQQAAQQQITSMLRQSFGGTQGGSTQGTTSGTTSRSNQPPRPPKG